MSNIKILYTWDKETYLKASEIVYKYELKDSPKRFIGWVFIAMSQFGVVQTMKGGGIGLLLLSSILILYWYYFRWEIRKLILIKNFNKLPNANYQFNILANHEGITIDNRLIEWNKIENIISLKDGFLLYYNNSFLFFPLSAFEDIEKKNQFGLLVKTNC